MMPAGTVMASANNGGTAMVAPLSTLFARVRDGGAIHCSGSPTVFSHSEGEGGARKPRMLVTVALANKTARIVWAVMRSGQS